MASAFAVVRREHLTFYENCLPSGVRPGGERKEGEWGKKSVM